MGYEAGWLFEDSLVFLGRLCGSKFTGGIGFCDLHLFNLAMFAKKRVEVDK